MARLQAYLRSAFRTVRSQPIFAVVNLVGMMIGLATALLVITYTQYERTADSFHAASDRIYRIHTEQQEGGDRTFTAYTPARLAPALIAEAPGVEESVRMQFARPDMASEYHEGKPRRFFRVDAAFFDVFDIPVLHGRAQGALEAPNSIVLSRHAAQTYFPGEDAVGKTLMLRGKDEYQVTAVVGRMPPSSHLQFDVLASWDDEGTGAWDQFRTFTYVLAAESAAIGQLRAAIDAASQRSTERSGHPVAFHAQALSDLRLYAPDGSFAWQGAGGRLVFFGLVGLFILFMACVNYTSLATAQAHRRSGEVGVRKACGASRRELAGQFLFESVVSALCAGLAALLLSVAALPGFNALVGVELTFASLLEPMTLGVFVCTIVLAGLAAGAYPASVLALQSPVKNLSSESRGERFSMVQKGLVVFQFGLAIILMIGTLTVWNQISYLKTKSLGYEPENRIVLRAYDLSAQANTVAQELEQHASIRSVAATSCVPSWSSFEVSTIQKGQAARNTSVNEGAEGLTMHRCSTSPGTLSALGLRIVDGRNIRSSEAKRAVLVNETAATHLRSPEQPRVLGQTLSWEQPYWTKTDGEWVRRREVRTVQVTGIVEDFHFGSIKNQIRPLILQYDPDDLANFVVHARDGALSDARSTLEAYWAQRVPDRPFEYQSLSVNVVDQFQQEERRQTLAGIFAVLSVLLASLGLFGLAAFVMSGREQEVAVRKSLGASISSILVLLVKSFLKLVGVSACIAVPVAWFFAQRWLDNFAYHEGPAIAVFALAIGVAFVVALGTVSFWSIRAAQSDPASALRAGGA